MARRATNVTHTRIQAVARARFARSGYDATSLQQIAADLDVTKAALYYHFPSKAELLHSLADPLLDGERTLLAGYTDGPLADAARRALVCALIDLLLAHRPVVAWLTRDLSALAQPKIGARVEANTERLQRLRVAPGLFPGQRWSGRPARSNVLQLRKRSDAPQRFSGLRCGRRGSEA